MTRPSARKPAALSPRQEAIVRLLGEGLTQAAIGVKLGISVRTVEMHLARARQRAGVASTNALLSRARLRALGPRSTTDRDSTDGGIPI